MWRRILCLALAVAACDRSSSPARDAGAAPSAPVGLAAPASPAGPANSASARPTVAAAPLTPAASASARPAPSATVAPLSPPRGTPEVVLPEGAPEEVLRLQPKILACYTRALARVPTLEGPVVLEIHVASTGDASEASATSERIDAEALECIRGAVLGTRFTSTVADTRTLKVAVDLAIRSSRAAGSP